MIAGWQQRVGTPKNALKTVSIKSECCLDVCKVGILIYETGSTQMEMLVTKISEDYMRKCSKFQCEMFIFCI